MAKTPQENAVESLVALLALQRERVTWLERCIANLKDFQADNVIPGLPPVRNHLVQPGQYRSMKFGEALKAYLFDRGEVPVSRVAADLTTGGVETLVKQKTPGERLRRLRITIGNNKKYVLFDEQNDTVRLRPEKGKNSTSQEVQLSVS